MDTSNCGKKEGRKKGEKERGRKKERGEAGRKEWKRNQNYSQIPGWPQRNNFISIPKEHIGLWHWLYGVRIILQIKNTLFHITMSRFKFQSYSLSDVWALGTYFFSILGPLSEKWDTHGISLIELLWILNNTCKELE